MARRHGFGAEITSRPQEIGELHRLVAAHARDRRLAAQIGIGELVDYRGAETALEIEHVMRNAKERGDTPGIMDVLPGTARALAPDGGAVVVELQRDADDIETLLHQQRGGHRAVDAARHGDDYAALGRLLRE